MNIYVHAYEHFYKVKIVMLRMLNAKLLSKSEMKDPRTEICNVEYDELLKKLVCSWPQSSTLFFFAFHVCAIKPTRKTEWDRSELSIRERKNSVDKNKKMNLKILCDFVFDTFSHWFPCSHFGIVIWFSCRFYFSYFDIIFKSENSHSQP